MTNGHSSCTRIAKRVPQANQTPRRRADRPIKPHGPCLRRRRRQAVMVAAITVEGAGDASLERGTSRRLT